jgi:exodeoxyribonuclease VII small subunit
MSKPKSPGVDEPVAGPNLSFEEALKRLESIVEAMENADLPLETLLARFEQGAQLVQLCQTRLADAELKIQQLDKSAAGQIVMKPVSLAEDAAQV